MNATARVCAYIRKSVRGRDALDRSRDNQTAAVAALAARDGVTIAHIYDGDWGRSGGRKGQAKRSAMADLTASVKAGEVSALYAYSLDRIGRDTEYGLALWHACAEQGVPIIVDGSRYDTSSGEDRMRFVLTMEMAAQELDRIAKRNRDIKARARARLEAGEITPDEAQRQQGGQAVYGADPKRPAEDAGRVVAAYKEAGSFLGAARLLTAAGVPTRHGRPWTVTTVSAIIRREAPEIARERIARQGMAPKRTRVFSGLLRCRCGAVLTAFSRAGRKRVDGSTGPRSVAYYCRAGHLDARHGAPLMVSEPKMITWAKVEAARVGPKYEAHYAASEAGTLAAIEGKRAKLDAKLDMGRVTPDQYRVQMAALNKEAATATAAVERVGGSFSAQVRWNGEPSDANADLRALWSEVILGPDMLPVKAVWYVEPRSDDEEAAYDAELQAAVMRGDYG